MKSKPSHLNILLVDIFFKVIDMMMHYHCFYKIYELHQVEVSFHKVIVEKVQNRLIQCIEV